MKNGLIFTDNESDDKILTKMAACNYTIETEKRK